MNIILIFIIVLCYYSIRVSDNQMIGFGPCPNSENYIHDFDLSKYIGTWFEQYRYFMNLNVGTICTQTNITHSEDGSMIYLVKYYTSWSDDFEKLTGNMKIDGSEGEGQFLINFINTKFSTKYKVIQTDYQNYSIVITCDGDNKYHSRNIYIFTRVPFPSIEILSKALKQLKEQTKYSSNILYRIDHVSCMKIDTTNIDTDLDAEYLEAMEYYGGVE